MQTFLPFEDFTKSAAVLDRQRLGKQRLECKQIITALEKADQGIKAGWQTHPAVLMWKGSIYWLAMYGEAVCREWASRGYEDNLLSFFTSRLVTVDARPKWLGDERFHSSHRARLLMKDPSWYSQFGWVEAPSETYWWPTVEMPRPPPTTTLLSTPASETESRTCIGNSTQELMMWLRTPSVLSRSGCGRRG